MQTKHDCAKDNLCDYEKRKRRNIIPITSTKCLHLDKGTNETALADKIPQIQTFRNTPLFESIITANDLLTERCKNFRCLCTNQKVAFSWIMNASSVTNLALISFKDKDASSNHRSYSECNYIRLSYYDLIKEAFD